ncbi:polysaccharide pyruvyl transferase family protein [Lactococcus carnosus]|uniref:polysaccharide pyruvyl transferase family protein n=1 Tax=Pseudolactococcus carnosus TaxID=2749961 RepID=UPI001FBA9815|nr:polysaccharide pyruvyl transferase family protein [Lactococcus carnosus]MBR6895416.1 polysaccharide pyruvyl transferase family protein [Lactococcus sp.]MCJ1970481.1 hypothetical protein [Lactococcus carnosus]
MLKTLIKNNISPKVWSKLAALKHYFLTRNEVSPFSEKLVESKKIFILGAADYENLGDHAIAYAQYQYIIETLIESKESSEFTVVEVPSRTPIRFVKNIVMPKDIFLYTGGGNLGTTYKMLDAIFLPIIKAYPNNSHLFFPQSFTFLENDSARRRTRIKAIFDKAGKNLTITARESKSKKLFEDYFDRNTIIFTPDIVMMLDLASDYNNLSRKGIAMLMRGDGEKVLSESEQSVLRDMLKVNHQVDFEVANDDLAVVLPPDRDEVLKNLWASVAKHELVITDRLHGMIFAKITGTPCIAIDNQNSKIKMTYMDWLQDAKQIAFIDPRDSIQVNQIVGLANELIATPAINVPLSKQYQVLTDKLTELILAQV